MNKIRLLIFTVLVACFLFSVPARAENNVNVYFFWGEGCPHCAKEEDLLAYYSHKYPYIKVIDFELYKNYSNGQILLRVAEILGVNVDGIPFTVIGDKYYSGYHEILTPSLISERIEYCHNNTCPDSLAGLIDGESGDAISEKELSELAVGTEGVESESTTSQVAQSDVTSTAIIFGEEQAAGNGENIYLPILGEVDAVNFSLPLIAVVMGVLDGFNPCALWTLLFLISLLLGMQNRWRMWILGSTFIVASASVYFLFMAAWLNFILFIGFVVWVRLLIGGVALLGGGYNIKEFVFNRGGGCKITGNENRQKIFARLKSAVQQKSFIFAFIGIIALAFAVNLVELICSAGLPAVYTQILAMNELSGWQYYSYILLYILFFMIDDLFIFFAAMITLKMTGISTRYSRYSRLIGGLLMIIIGILLLFKPEWLMFG